MSSGIDADSQSPQVNGGEPEAEGDEIHVTVGAESAEWLIPPELPEAQTPSTSADAEDPDAIEVPQENFPPIAYTISDAADVDITQPTANWVTISAKEKKAQESRPAPKPGPDQATLDRQAAERQAAEAQLAAMMAAAAENNPPAQPDGRVTQMRTESQEVAERVRQNRPARPAYTQPTGTLKQKHGSVLGLVRHDKPDPADPAAPGDETAPGD
jgi:hypothetical protein